MSWTQLLSKFFFSDGTFLQDVRFGETATPEHTCPDLHLLTAVQTRQCNRCSWVFNTWFIMGFSFSPQWSILMQNNEDFKFKVNSETTQSFWEELWLVLNWKASFSPEFFSSGSFRCFTFESQLLFKVMKTLWSASAPSCRDSSDTRSAGFLSL